MVEQKNRLIFLDLLRAFAVLMMVQGHTVDTLLSDDYRTTDSLFFLFWRGMRGYTAPIFMFTSGAVFTYLFYLKGLPFKINPRVKKGFNRFLLLVFIGYLLRYPTATIFDFSSVTERGWVIFFSVDALHLIGWGLFFILLFSFLGEKFKMNKYLLYSFLAVTFLIFTPFLTTFDWKEILPLPIAAYFYKDTGSLFPFFPWLGYMFGGAVFGYYLSKNKDSFKSFRFSSSLMILGGSLFIFALITQYYIIEISGGDSWLFVSAVDLERIGVVIFIAGVISYIALKLKTIPQIIFLVGRYTLLIYAVHLVILYGSAWSIGMINYLKHELSLGMTVLSVLIMYSLMIGLVLGVEKLKRKNIFEKISQYKISFFRSDA